MPVLELLVGLRVVAAPAALDSAHWQGEVVTILRSASDEAFAIGSDGVELDDPDAIVEAESGFAGAWVETSALIPHIEWALPPSRPALAQGSVAGVPAKLWLPDEGPALLVVQAAYSADLAERLGWAR